MQPVYNKAFGDKARRPGPPATEPVCMAAGHEQAKVQIRDPNAIEGSRDFRVSLINLEAGVLINACC